MFGRQLVICAIFTVVAALVMQSHADVDCTKTGVNACPDGMPVWAYFETEDCNGPIVRFMTYPGGPEDMETCVSNAQNSEMAFVDEETSYVRHRRWLGQRLCPEVNATTSFDATYHRPYQCVPQLYATTERSRMLLLDARDGVVPGTPYTPRGDLPSVVDDVVRNQVCPLWNDCTFHDYDAPIYYRTRTPDDGDCESTPTDTVAYFNLTMGQCYRGDFEGWFQSFHCHENGLVTYTFTGNGCEHLFMVLHRSEHCESYFFNSTCSDPSLPISLQPVVFPPPGTGNTVVPTAEEIPMIAPSGPTLIGEGDVEVLLFFAQNCPNSPQTITFAADITQCQKFSFSGTDYYFRADCWTNATSHGFYCQSDSNCDPSSCIPLPTVPADTCANINIEDLIKSVKFLCPNVPALMPPPPDAASGHSHRPSPFSASFLALFILFALVLLFQIA